MLPSFFTLFFFALIYTTWALQEANETLTLGNDTIVISKRLSDSKSPPPYSRPASSSSTGSESSYDGVPSGPSPYRPESLTHSGQSSAYLPSYSDLSKQVQLEVLRGPWKARDRKKPIVPGVFKVQLSDGTIMLMRKRNIKMKDAEISHLLRFHKTVVWAVGRSLPSFSKAYKYAYIAVPDLDYVPAEETKLRVGELEYLREEASELLLADKKYTKPDRYVYQRLQDGGYKAVFV